MDYDWRTASHFHLLLHIFSVTRVALIAEITTDICFQYWTRVKHWRGGRGGGVQYSWVVREFRVPWVGDGVTWSEDQLDKHWWEMRTRTAAYFSRAAFPSSLALCSRPRVQAKILATGFVLVGLPYTRQNIDDRLLFFILGSFLMLQCIFLKMIQDETRFMSPNFSVSRLNGYSHRTRIDIRPRPELRLRVSFTQVGRK